MSLVRPNGNHFDGKIPPRRILKTPRGRKEIRRPINPDTGGPGIGGRGGTK